MGLISESDQKIINSYTSMIQQSMVEVSKHPKTEAVHVADYRAMMLRINPFKFPPGIKLKDVASFRGKVPLRDGLTAAIAIPRGKGPFPIMIHAHGHGLRAGRPPEYEPWIREMSWHGAVVIFPDFSWQPEHSFQDQVDDMLFTISWARANAAVLSGDATRMTLGGDSGGARLAFDVLMRTLADPSAPRFKAFVSVDGDPGGASPYDHAEPVLLPTLQPENDLPPIFLVVGSADDNALSAIRMANKLMEIKKDYELAIFWGMPHDFVKFPGMDAMHQANDRLMNFVLRTA